jgi:predicted acyltransferase
MNKSERLLSLDVFRGITICLMIVVNNPGSWEYVYAPLRHSAWHGCTPTDLVFPFFMFIMGTAMWYSFKKYGSRISKGISIKILRRTAVIYLIGLALNAYSAYSLEWSSLRIMGVLPRIALAYGAASFIVLGVGTKKPDIGTGKRSGLGSDMRMGIITGIILVGYWAILLAFGGENPYALEGNFVSRFDIRVLGSGHIPIFHGVKFDQTGLLSTLPSVGNVLIGYLAGGLTQRSNKTDAVKKLLALGLAGIAISLIWSLAFPINKPLWTSTFVLLTSGLAMLCLGILLWIIDIRGKSGWTMPFQVFGKNPLFIYVLSIVLSITIGVVKIPSAHGELQSIKSFIFTGWFEPLTGSMFGSLLFALTMTALCWFVGWLLFRRRIFIKI